MAVTPERLRLQVGWLLKRGFMPALFHDALTRPAASRTVAVTFDDGFRSVLEHGFPVLSALGVPATIFVSTNDVDEQPRPFVGPAHSRYLGTSHEHELFGMTWDELRRVADAGWEIGSHAMSHPLLTRITDDQLDRELEVSRARIEEVLGRPCLTLAYPSGDFDQRVTAAAARAGYEAAATLPERFPRVPEPLAWPRVFVNRNDTLKAFKLKTSPTVRLLRTTLLWLPVNAVRLRIRGTSESAPGPKE